MKRVIVAAVVVLLTAGSAHAWTSNSGDHERMSTILRNGLSCLRTSNFNAADSGWADTAAARDGQGTLYLDEENTYWTGFGDMGHAFFPSWPQGVAPDNAAGFFRNVAWYDGYDKYYGYALARGAHFIQDMGVVFHTYGQVFCQASHGAYESWVWSNWDGQSFGSSFTQGMNYQLSNNSPSKSQDKAQLTRDLASTSRQYMTWICNNGPVWSNNTWATRSLMYYTGKYTAAYVRGNGICN